MKVYALTLGCKVNQYESDALLTLFAKHGYEFTEDIQEADVIIVNSCTVTSVSAGKSRQAVRRAKKSNPNAVVVLTGCYSEIDYEKAGQILEADIVTGANHKEKILELVEQALRNKERILVQNSQKNLTIDDLPTPVSGTRTRAFLKIQDGCNNYCSYCIIPFARGPVRSRDFDDCIKRIKELDESGYKETVLTGIHLASFGKGTDKDLIDLLEAVGKQVPRMKIRLGSMDPSYLNEEKIIRLSYIPNLCAHYHLSLQSGCDATLKRMNRKYTVAEYANVAGLLQKHIPDVSLTTDIIVGFPGETEEEFKETVQFIQDVGLYRLHVFPYSPREGTKAAKMPNQIPKAVKDERSEVLIALNRDLMARHHEKFLGRTLKVLFETEFQDEEGGVSGAYYEGLTDNYIKTVSSNPNIVTGEFSDVRLLRSQGEYVIAE